VAVTSDESVVEAARALVPMLREGAPAAEKARRQPDATIAALRDLGALHLCTPASVGGLECHPRVYLDTLMTLAEGDASAAWIAMVTSTTGLVAAYVDDETAREVFARPSIACGVFAPFGRGAYDGDTGDAVISGRWAFVSASPHADWIGLGSLIKTPGGDGMAHRLALFPASEVTIHDTWDVAGLCATASHDVSVEDVRVPERRLADLLGARPREDGPLYAFPLFGLLATGIAGVALGTARAALDTVIELASARKPSGSSRSLSERATAQAGIAEAEASLRSARAFLAEAIDEAWEKAVLSGELDVEARATLRLAATHATTTAAAVAERSYRLGGGGALYKRSPLQRYLRDTQAATQHMMVSPNTLEVTGRVLLGLETDASQL
jgi:alkylation response protein AidB-like acyl-CoA dehydrogenase